MSTETKNKKTLPIMVIVPILLLLAIGTIIGLGVKSKEDLTVTQSLYNEAMDLVRIAEVPTYFDENDDAIQNVFLSSTLASSLESTDVAEDIKSDLLLDFVFYDKDTDQTINYTLLNYSSDYDYIVENGGESVILENDQEVYKYQEGYFWKLKSGLYGSVFSHSEIPDDDLLLKTIVSVGEPKLNLFENIKFNKDTKVKEPTYTMNDSTYASSVVIEYIVQNEKLPISTLSLYYDDFVLYQSYDLDYTGEDFMGKYTEDAFEKIDFNGKTAYLDKLYNSIHYKHDDLSIWLLSNGEVEDENEVLKVFESISFKK